MFQRHLSQSISKPNPLQARARWIRSLQMSLVVSHSLSFTACRRDPASGPAEFPTFWVFLAISSWCLAAASTISSIAWKPEVQSKGWRDPDSALGAKAHCRRCWAYRLSHFSFPTKDAGYTQMRGMTAGLFCCSVTILPLRTRRFIWGLLWNATNI